MNKNKRYWKLRRLQALILMTGAGLLTGTLIWVGLVLTASPDGHAFDYPTQVIARVSFAVVVWLVAFIVIWALRYNKAVDRLDLIKEEEETAEFAKLRTDVFTIVKKIIGIDYETYEAVEHATTPGELKAGIEAVRRLNLGTIPKEVDFALSHFLDTKLLQKA